MNFYDILILLGIIRIPGYNSDFARVDGFTLFSDEYSKTESFAKVKELVSKNAKDTFLRIPVPSNTNALTGCFANSVRLAQQNGINVVFLFDEFYNHNLMIGRINYVISNFGARFFEIFNEIPQCKYAGEQITSMDDLINKINAYVVYIKHQRPDAKIISMAPVNSLEDTYFDDLKISNKDQLKRLILETKTDIIGMHLYCYAAQQKMRLKGLIEDVKNWKSEASNKLGINKQVWITESGLDEWDNQVDFYNKWTSRFIEYFSAERLFWYRMSIAKESDADSGYALEYRDTGTKSPLWNYLNNKKKT